VAPLFPLLAIHNLTVARSRLGLDDALRGSDMPSSDKKVPLNFHNVAANSFRAPIRRWRFIGGLGYQLFFAWSDLLLLTAHLHKYVHIYCTHALISLPTE
jgi:hypothetical protein